MALDKEKLTPEQQEVLNDYHRAFEGEFTDSLDTWKETTEKAYNDLAEALPIANATIVHLAQGAESEGVRLKAAIFIYDKVLGRDAVINPHDPLADLVNRLRKSAIDV